MFFCQKPAAEGPQQLNTGMCFLRPRAGVQFNRDIKENTNAEFLDKDIVHPAAFRSFPCEELFKFEVDAVHFLAKHIVLSHVFYR